MPSLSFDEVFHTATGGDRPYDYQRRIADDGFPDVLAAPTGTGKTAATVLAWIYRRHFHPDLAERAATPRRLVFVLPMRVLVEQTVGKVTEWVRALGLTESIECHVLMGGEPRNGSLRMHCERDAIIVGTLDMVVSRMLNRGYGESRFVWPIDFGLLNNGCHFVFDEVQLMGPALATTRQLHGLRHKLGTAMPCTSTWMSATVTVGALQTIDAPGIGTPLELASSDWQGGLAKRLNATRRVVELATETDDRQRADQVAAEIAARHQPGTLTLVVMNTVDRARRLRGALVKAGMQPPPLLLHSRFRPEDRAKLVKEATSAVDPSGPGRVVVSTQVIEAGVDISAELLVTEVAPWPSIVQRAGRCNRDGEAADATLAWMRVPENGAAPYDPADIAAATAELESWAGLAATSQALRERPVAVKPVLVPVLRRRDLLDLFDTAPDLDGNDVDVARFIRDADDIDVTLAAHEWRADRR